MNAGGVLNTCKSSEAEGGNSFQSSGGRVSNTWVTCPEVGNTSGKLELIPHDIFGTKVLAIKAGSQDLALPDGPAPD
jgi:hypothetical protein